MSEAPLAGRRVVVTRPRHQAEGFGRMLSDAGASVVFVPVISIFDPDSWDAADRAVPKLAEGLYAWVLFTSANAVDRWWARVVGAGYDARAFGRTRIVAVGPSTARALRAHGLHADVVPADFTAEAAAEALGRGAGPVLLPRAQGAPRDVVRALEAHGWRPDDVPVYQTLRTPAETPEADTVRAGRFDVVTFTSGSTARSFAEIVGAPEQLGLAPDGDPGKLVACIGPRTAAAARDVGFRVDVVAADHTAQGLVQAVVDAVATSR